MSRMIINRNTAIACLALFFLAATGFVMKEGTGSIFSSFRNYSPYFVFSGSDKSPDAELMRNSARLLYTQYKASGDDTLSSLADSFGTDVGTLRLSNGINLSSLHAGEVVNVLNRKGMLYEASDNDTLESVAKRYLPKNKTLEVFSNEIVKENLLPPSALIVGYSFSKGDKIFIPGIKPTVITAKRLSAVPQKKFVPHKAAMAKLYIFPLAYKRISSGFGYRYHPKKHKQILHKGCDFQAPAGTPVFAARAGIVKEAGWQRGYGNTVEILHQDGYITRYAHLSAINVKKGDNVSQGKSKIGEVGKSGLATGYHLHFELISPKGRVQDPMPSIKK